MWPFKRRAFASRHQPAVELVLLLLERREGWTFDQYHARHVTGPSMWIANRDYGLALSLEKAQGGGIETDGPPVRLCDKDKNALWQAFCKMRDGIAGEELEGDVLALAGRVQEFASRLSGENVIQAEFRATLASGADCD